MVRVVEYKPAPAVVKQIICTNCGALLEYTPHEVQRYSGRDISGGPDGMEWIDCPVCTNRAVIRAW